MGGGGLAIGVRLREFGAEQHEMGERHPRDIYWGGDDSASCDFRLFRMYGQRAKTISRFEGVIIEIRCVVFPR